MSVFCEAPYHTTGRQACQLVKPAWLLHDRHDAVGTADAKVLGHDEKKLRSMTSVRLTAAKTGALIISGYV